MSTARSLGLLALVGLVGFALGVLTAYGQGWLPHEANSFANSTGSWALAAFLLALLATRWEVAAACGAITLFTLLAGYVVGGELRDVATGSTIWLFWGTAAVLAGPMLGLGAYWVRFGRDELAAVGVGSLSGVLIGEGAYGLLYISDTTYPLYWWGQIGVGAILLVSVALNRLRRPPALFLALAVTGVVAVVFVAVYSRASDILGSIS